MLKNYFKIAWRNLFRNKGFSITNILGLAIGMTCTMLIFMWVQDEVTYNKFNANYNEIYQIVANRDFNNQVFTDYNMAFPLGKATKQEVPQVKNTALTTHDEQHVLAYADTKLTKTGYDVTEHFFDVFSYKFTKGNPATAISDPSFIVLTEASAKALFGNADPIGKVVKMDNDRNFKVSAILANVPNNSTLQFDYIIPFNYSSDWVKRAMKEWSNSSFNLFVQTVPGANIPLLTSNINALKKRHSPKDKISTYFTFPMNKWRLYSDFKDGKNIGGMIEYVNLFTAIAIIILLIACINFMNLSTARSEKRSKEVGIRKTLGSEKKQLVLQFFFESMILALIAFAFSLLAVFLLLTPFNLLVGKQLSLNLADPLFWAGCIIIVLFTGVVAGSYPALYLSSFNPVQVLKGTFLAGKKAALPRRILVVGQFVISILLISATIIVYQQMQHVKNRDMGYTPSNLIMMTSSPATDKNYTVIKQELLKTGMVKAVTRAGAPITGVEWRMGAPEWAGKRDDQNIIVGGLNTDIDFTKTMGIKILAGKDFEGTAADSAYLLLNKAAVDAMGLKNPVGMVMKTGDKKYTVLGVTGNVVAESPYKPVNPLLMFFNPYDTYSINVRLNDKVLPQQAIQAMEPIFKKYNPDFPFEYQFVDQEFNKKFLTEDLIGKITNIFAGLAIFICCIGLAGLASFTIEKRIREIGIRKILGATVQQLLTLISKEFLKLVLIAFVIAVPLTWWLMSNWLSKYDYRINISIWLFGLVGILILLLTVVVVSINTLRAALANPVKNLRTE
jgi:ABC-type antimicrobial peptide transport system permease subunit